MKKKPEEMNERELIFTLLSDKVGAVDPRDVIYVKRIESGKNAGKYSVLLGGKKITANGAKNLAEEAALFQQTQLYKILTQTLSHEASLRMFKLAKTERDMDFGKAILHSVSVFETIISAAKNISPDEIAK